MASIIGWMLTQPGHAAQEKVMFSLSDIVCGHQLSTAYHALHLCYLVCVTAHASLVHVYGIALYLWFSAEIYRLDDLGGIRNLRLVGLRLVLNAGLAALEWVQYWQCSLSNVGHRLGYG